MKTLLHIAEKVKNQVFDVFAGIFVVLASVVIHVSKAEHDTWPSLEEMRNTKINREKAG
jgi:hypothetical protein